MSSSSTPIYGFPFPNGDDSLSNLANRIQELAYYIEYTYETLGIALSSSTPIMYVGQAAGGALSGTYPNPSFAVDMATQAELDAHTSASTSVHGISNTSNLVYTSDSRLSDTRTPTDGSVTNAKVASGAAIAYSKLNLSGSVKTSDLNFSVATQAAIDAVAADLATHKANAISVHGISNTANLVYTSDSRLSDARTPTTHASSHASAGTDPITISPSQVSGTAVITTDSRLSDARTPTGTAGGDLAGSYPNPTLATSGATAGSYTKVTVTNKGIVTSGTTLSASDVPTLTLSKISDAGTAAAKNYPATGNAASAEVVLGSDTRLTDSRTPTTHASTHIPGGSDAVDLSKIIAQGVSLPVSFTLYPAGALFAQGATPPYTLYRSTGSAWEQVAASSSGTTPSGPAGGDLTGTYPNPTLAAAGTSGTYTKVTTDSKGRVTSGTVLASTDLPTAGTAGTYTKVTTDAYGRVTSGTTLGATDIPTLTLSKISDAGTAAAKNIPVTGNASSTEVVFGTDTRLTDSRTPTSHASTHAAAGSDPITISPSQVTGTAVITTDSRLSDSRTPTSHASSHAAAGSDPLTLSASQITGTAVTQADTGTVTSTMIANGTIVDADISASAAIADTKLATISTASKVSNSATTATSSNTASAIVARDASGNFTAGTITATLNGNASTVTTNANLTGDVTSTGNATTIASGAVTSAKLATSVANALAPAGSMMMYAGATAPSGWVLCDGTTYDGTNATYTALWGVIGTTYGGTGQSSFAVPDMRGNVPIGVKSTQTASPDISARGKTGGAYTFTISANQIPAHTHSFTPAGTLSGSTASFDASHGHSHALTLPNHTHPASAAGFRYTTIGTATGSSSFLAYSGTTFSNRDTGYNTDNPSTNPTIGGTVTNATTNTSAASLNHTHGVGTLAFTGTAGTTNNNTTTGSAVDNFQPFLAVNYIIKL